MDNKLIFNFSAQVSEIDLPDKLNNPFGTSIPEIAKLAALEFQNFLKKSTPSLGHDFNIHKGKMFGVLVVQLRDHSLAYLGTVSGKLANNTICDNFVPSVFDPATDDFFINKGMTELTLMSNKIKASKDLLEIEKLTADRKLKSYGLQQRLFENYSFLSLSGTNKNVLEIFKHSAHGNPPAAAGECAAPKLLQYALRHKLTPIAIAEFWWGQASKNATRKHLDFYPACKDKCRPILEYMLDDKTLFAKA